MAAVWLLAAGGSAASGQPLAAKPDFSLSKHDFADTLSIDYRQGRVGLTVVVGDRPLRFLLDTGSGRAVVYPDTPINGLQRVGRTVAVDAVGHRDTADVVALPPLTLGTLTLTGCRAIVQPRPAGRRDYDGVLGFDLVSRGLLLKIDAAQRQVVLTDRRRHFDGEPGVDVRYRLVRHVPWVKATPYAGFAEETLLDTGSARLFALNRQRFDEALRRVGAAVERQTEGRSPGRHAMGNGGAEADGEVVFLAIDSLCVGALSLADVHAVTTQGPSSIGGPLLDHCALVFMPRRKRLRLQPVQGGTRVEVANPQQQLAFIVEGDQTVVGLVWPQGRAWQAGFRVGDVVRRKYPDGTYLLLSPDGQQKTIVWP